jgi:hypothetical protein
MSTSSKTLYLLQTSYSLESRWLILNTYGFVRNVNSVFQRIKPESGVRERDATNILLQNDTNLTDVRNAWLKKEP